MTIELGIPRIDGLGAAVEALRAWQYEGALIQLHPGDLGWFWRFGAQRTAAAVRTWSRGGRILAVGLLDGEDLLRLTIAPDARQDEELTRCLAADVAGPDRGVLGAGQAYLEAPMDALLQDHLQAEGWTPGEPWTPLRRGLAEPVELPEGLRVEVAGPHRAADRAAVQRAAFERSTFSEDKWPVMASGLPYSDARCLLAYDAQGDPVAAVTVWSAGPGKPGLLEPMGVHRDHRGRGYGRAICLAAAAALRDLGCSSAVVNTASSNTAAVATYESAGYRKLPGTRDLTRSGPAMPIT